MVTITKVGKDTLIPYIHASFHGDELLCSIYHINPGNTDQCAIHTYNRILQLHEEKVASDMEEFGISEGDTKIGYIVLSRNLNLLYSFGINKHFRNEEIKKIFLNFVRSYIGGPVQVFIYQKNIPAVRFLCNNGWKIKSEIVDDGEIALDLQLL